MAEKVFKSPYPVGKTPTYVPNEPVFFNDVLLGLARLKKRKDNAPEQDVLLAQKFKIESSLVDYNNNTTAFTCPAGKRAYLVCLNIADWHGGASGYNFTEVDIGVGQINISSYTQNTTQNIIIQPAQGIVLDAGESIKIYTDALSKCQITGFGYYYPL